MGNTTNKIQRQEQRKTPATGSNVKTPVILPIPISTGKGEKVKLRNLNGQ